ncbi:tetratricopeptide repeat protein [Longispora sp. NPDC051575]|uniref:tetratricopeptide repeat protein n=1 Tax=Longispora sp. NPDC051575 TaxID=3154943 RepID=UPI00341B6B11
MQISLVLGLAGTIALVAAVGLRWQVVFRLSSDSGNGWMWVERSSWIAGVGGLVVALVSALIQRWSKAPVRQAVPKPHSGVPRSASGSGAGTSTVEVPFGRIDKPIHGRDGLVRSLTNLLNRRVAGPRVHILYGLGGCGKTTVALMLAQWAVRRRVAVWWVSAGTTNDLQTGMRHVASRLGAGSEEIDRAWSGVDSATDLLWRLLDQSNDRWLLIVDNADEPESLAGSGHAFSDATGWLRSPSSDKGHVIVTSRQGDADVWGAWCRLHPIPLLPARVSAQILLDHTGTGAGTVREAEALASRLGGLPLALRLAGSYIAEAMAVPWQVSTSTFSRYQSLLEAGRLDEVLGVRIGSSGWTSEQSRAVVGRTWEMSLDLLGRRGLFQARPLLRLLSHLGDAPIPVGLILHPDTLATFELFDGIDGLRLWRLLRALAHLGLVDLPLAFPGWDAGTPEVATSHMLTIHPLVRQIGRHQRDAVGGDTCYLAMAAAVLRRSTEDEGALSAEDPERWAIWESLAPHTFSVVGAVGSLPDLARETAEHITDAMLMTSNYLRARGLYSQAEAGHRRTLASCRTVLGDRHLGIMAVRHSFAAIVHVRGQFKAADAEYRGVLADRQLVLGDVHADTLATRHQLAMLLYDRGWLDSAEAEWREVVTINEAARGRDHLLTMNSRHMLARVWLDRGELEAAETAFQVVLASQRRVLGEDHPRTLGTRHDLARVLHKRGQLDAAECEYNTVCDAQRRVLGQDHRDSLLTLSQLAKVLHDRGSLAAAESAYRTTASVQRRVLGEDHPMTLTTYSRLAHVLCDRGDLHAAVAVYDAVLAGRQRVLGPHHPETTSTWRRLSSLQHCRSGHGHPNG